MKIYQRISGEALNGSPQELQEHQQVLYPFMYVWQLIYKSNKYQLSINKFETTMMQKNLTLGIFICVLLCLCQSKFDQKRIRLAKQNQYHRVVGGSTPVNEQSQYQYQKMISFLQKHYNLKLPRLVSISLLNYYGANQTKSKYIQHNFYNQYYSRPNQAVTQRGGSRHANFLHWFSVRGVYISPSILPVFLRKAFKKYYKYLIVDPLQQIFEVIQKQLSYNIRSIVYVHSMQGLDRVGYVLGAYRLKNNATLSQVIKQNTAVLKKFNVESLSSNYQYGLQWYCLALGRSEQECLFYNTVSKQSNQL